MAGTPRWRRKLAKREQRDVRQEKRWSDNVADRHYGLDRAILTALGGQRRFMVVLTVLAIIAFFWILTTPF